MQRTLNAFSEKRTPNKATRAIGSYLKQNSEISSNVWTDLRKASFLNRSCVGQPYDQNQGRLAALILERGLRCTRLPRVPPGRLQRLRGPAAFARLALDTACGTTAERIVLPGV